MKEFEYKLKLAQEFEDKDQNLHALQIYLQLLEDEEASRIASIRLALVYEKLGRLDKAYEIMDGFVENNIEDEDVRKFYGHFLIRQQNYDRALDILSGVSTEENCDVFFLMGLSNFHIGEYKRSKINFDSFNKCNPGSELIPEANLYLAKIQLRLGEYDSALEYAKKSESFVSQNYDVHFTQAVTYYYKEMYFHALDAIKRAQTLNKDEAILQEWAGRIYVKLGEYEKAESSLKEFVTATEPDSEIYSLLGTVYKKNNKRKEAKDCFKKALHLDPNNQVALEAVETID